MGRGEEGGKQKQIGVEGHAHPELDMEVPRATNLQLIKHCSLALDVVEQLATST